MSDELHCLFVTFACIVTLVLPTPVQPLFAVCGFALAVLARVAPQREDAGHARHDRHDLSGR